MSDKNPLREERQRAADARERVRYNRRPPHQTAEALNPTPKTHNEGFPAFDEHVASPFQGAKLLSAEEYLAQQIHGLFEPPPAEAAHTTVDEVYATKKKDDEDDGPGSGHPGQGQGHWTKHVKEQRKKPKKTLAEIEENNRLQQQLAAQRVLQQALDTMQQGAPSTIAREKVSPATEGIISADFDTLAMQFLREYQEHPHPEHPHVEPPPHSWVEEVQQPHPDHGWDMDMG